MSLGFIILGICIIASIVVVVLAAKKYKYYKALAKTEQDNLEKFVKKLIAAKEEFEQKIQELELVRKIKKTLLAEKEKAAIEAVRLDEQNKAAVAKTQEEVKAEYARLKLELSKEHEVELQQLRISHDQWMQEHIDEFSTYATELEKLRASIAVVEQKKKDEAMKEDFIATHTLAITVKDYEDIATLTECRSRLNRKSVLDSLVWSEFVQGPLQQLRKDLVSIKLTEKVSGIYRITNTENDRCYIGQAVDIGKRWTEHIKMGLDAPSDKFHQALAQVPLYLWTWEILEKCEKSQLNEREKYWISHYKSNEFGYNTREGNR